MTLKGPLRKRTILSSSCSDPYLHRHCASGAIKDIRFANSSNDRLIQLVDMCAGAIARSYKRERSDARRWRDMLGPKIEDVWEFR
ncbi:MAG: DUF3800 domain-containing protein [Methylocystis sp.]|uniref:DUF3800 domain-containing protein n=1 Tax=Methylocystis sp. TaxID=1911079 RepID=UPI003DA42D99